MKENEKSKVVECLICGEKRHTLNGHYQKHGISKEEYLERFPNAKTISESHHEKLKSLLAKGRATIKNSKVSYSSKAEREIVQYLRDAGFTVLTPYRKLGFELDMFIPSKNIAIEYNGLRFHSELFGKKDRNYHANKTRKCNENGIRLIHIFEDEFVSNKYLVMQKLLHILGASFGEKIYARKCELKQVSSELKGAFFNKYHIQGNSNSTVTYGLFHKEELISAMSFNIYQNKNTGSKYDTYELTRFATKSEVIGIGMAGKLLNHFWKTHNPSSIVTFADLRWSDLNNNMYESLGFIKDGITPPDYMYLTKSFHKREHKYNYDKTKISQKFPELYNPNISEWENMKLIGIDRIWDVGKIRYIMENTVKAKQCNVAETGNRNFEIVKKKINYLGIDGRKLTQQQIDEALAFKTKKELKQRTEPILKDHYENPNSNKALNKDWDWNNIKDYKSNKLFLEKETVRKVVEMYLNEDKSLSQIGVAIGYSEHTSKAVLLQMGITINTTKKQWKGGKEANDERYKQKNKEKIAEYQKEYKEKNKDKINDYLKDYYQETKEYQQISKRKKSILDKKDKDKQ